jgi:hypothetical protein
VVFFDKQLTDVVSSDIDWLVANRVQENDRLDYKREMYGRDDEGKRELLRDVVALANHRGGRLLIGVDEDDEGGAKEAVGVLAGDHATWIHSLCLSSIDDRIVGLEVREIPLETDRVIVVIQVPESPQGPHMVTYKGLHQFWKRHGPRKDKMTVDEIRDGFLRGADARQRIQQFWASRTQESLDASGGGSFLLVSAIPAYFRAGQTLFDVRDRQLRERMQVPPAPYHLPHEIAYTVACGEPRPSLDGLRAAPAQQPDRHLEVHRTGYVEFRGPIRGWQSSSGQEWPMYGGVRHTEFLVSFAALVHWLYGAQAPGTPVVFRLALHNVQGLRIELGGGNWSQAWPRRHLEVGEFFLQDAAHDTRMVPKQMADRLWNAFELEESNVFDANANLRRGMS